MKYNYDKFLGHAQSMANFMNQDEVDFNILHNQKSDIDLSSFIQYHKSESRFPNEYIEYEPFKLSEDLQRYKAFLAE